MNPLTTIMNGYRDAFLYHRVPSLSGLGIVALIAIALDVIGYAIFKHLEKGFAEQF